MNTKGFNLGTTQQKVLFLIGCIGFATIIYFDKSYFDVYLLLERHPVFTLEYGIRGLAIFLSSAALLLSFVSPNKSQITLSAQEGPSFESKSVFSSLAIAVAILLLFLFKPVLFNILSMEDNIIEWGSAIFLFGGFAVMLLAFFKYKNIETRSSLARLGLIGLALVFFVMAMEEVSWFQRVVEVETPELFEGNQQKEMNLHNYYTDYTENIYYFGAFIFLVIFPFLRSQLGFLGKVELFKVLTPRPFIALVGAISCAYNYDMWNIVFTQLTFHSTVIILAVFTLKSARKNERNMILATLLVVLASQISFLSNGESFNRLWEITEYKELFMPLAFFIYTLDVNRQIKNGI